MAWLWRGTDALVWLTVSYHSAAFLKLPGTPLTLKYSLPSSYLSGARRGFISGGQFDFISFAYLHAHTVRALGTCR